MSISHASWDGSPSRWDTAEAYCASCLIDENDEQGTKVKDLCKLPVHEPGGALNANAVHAAAAALAGARGGVSASESAKDKARTKLRSLYRHLGEDPPASLTRSAPSPSRVPSLAFRVVAIDKAQRLVELVATSEAVDSFNTRFSYEASCDAFARALGNVREMHQDNAIGNIVKWLPDDQTRTIRVWVYVSKGAPDTWEKLLDGTLKGGSIGAANVQWARGTDGVPTATHYDLVEFSLVDNPSNPDCRILMVRMQTTPGGSDVTTATRARGKAMPPNALTSAPTNPADVVQSAQNSGMGKLIINTSQDPHAPDYGVPPAAGVRATPQLSGAQGHLAMDATTGGFFNGGHPTAGASVGEGEDPMPENFLSEEEELSELATALDSAIDQLRPKNQTPGQRAQGKGQAMPAQTARTPKIVQTEHGPAVLVPPGHRLTRDAQGHVLVTRDLVINDPEGDELLPLLEAELPGAMPQDARSAHHLRVAHATVHHAARVMEAHGATGCPPCAALARHARTLRDAIADTAGTGAELGEVTDAAEPLPMPHAHRVAHSAMHHAANLLEAHGQPETDQLARHARTIRDAYAGTAQMARKPQQTRAQMPSPDQLTALGRSQAAEAQRFQASVASAFAQMTQVLTGLSEKVEAIGAQPVTGGPVAMQTRGFQGMSQDDKIRTLTEFSQRSADPSVQMEAAAAILQLQQAGGK